MSETNKEEIFKYLDLLRVQSVSNDIRLELLMTEYLLTEDDAKNMLKEYTEVAGFRPQFLLG
jgi:hypothetical protein